MPRPPCRRGAGDESYQEKTKQGGGQRMQATACSACTQAPLHAPVTRPSTYPQHTGPWLSAPNAREHAEGQAWVLGGE